MRENIWYSYLCASLTITVESVTAITTDLRVHGISTQSCCHNKSTLHQRRPVFTPVVWYHWNKKNVRYITQV